MAELIIAKQRNGPTDTVRCASTRSTLASTTSPRASTRSSSRRETVCAKARRLVPETLARARDVAPRARGGRRGRRRQDDDGGGARRGGRAARQARPVPDDRPGAAARGGARPRADVGRGAGDRAGALRARGDAHPGLADGDDARHEAHVRRARRQVLVVARARAAAPRQPPLQVRLDVARRDAGVHGDGEARRRAARPALRPRHPRHAADRERARLPRRARAPGRGDRLGGDALVRPGVRVDREAVAQPARAVGGGRAARPRARSPAAASSRRWRSSSPS